MVYRGGCVAEYAIYLERSPSTYDEQIGVALAPRSEEGAIAMTLFVGLDVSGEGDGGVRRRRYGQSRVRTKGADRT